MCKKADFSFPQDARSEQCQEKKFEKYPDLAKEIGLLQLLTALYKNRHNGEQIAHWNMQNKANLNGPLGGFRMYSYSYSIVTPIVIGALETIPKALISNLEMGASIDIDFCSSFHGKNRLRKVLNPEGTGYQRLGSAFELPSFQVSLKYSDPTITLHFD